MQRKRQTDTSAGRLMVAIMGVFPAGFLGFLYFLQPDLVRPMLETDTGQILLAVVAVVVYGSMRWSSKILARVG